VKGRNSKGQDTTGENDEEHSDLKHSLLDNCHILAHAFVDPELKQLQCERERENKSEYREKSLNVETGLHSALFLHPTMASMLYHM
jgi:hypothetical protein